MGKLWKTTTFDSALVMMPNELEAYKEGPKARIQGNEWLHAHLRHVVKRSSRAERFLNEPTSTTPAVVDFVFHLRIEQPPQPPP